MERLTERHYKASDGYYMKCIEGCRLFSCEECEQFGEGVDRLGQIEDILGDTYDLDRLRELVEADKDGRIAILSEPMKPMVYKPNDTDVYCPKCGNTLSGGWELSDAGDCRKMVQCPKCGQAIDDTKCEPTAEAVLAKEADHE